MSSHVWADVHEQAWKTKVSFRSCSQELYTLLLFVCFAFCLEEVFLFLFHYVVSLYSPGWTGTCCANQAGLNQKLAQFLSPECPWLTLPFETGPLSAPGLSHSARPSRQQAPHPECGHPRQVPLCLTFYLVVKHQTQQAQPSHLLALIYHFNRSICRVKQKLIAAQQRGVGVIPLCEECKSLTLVLWGREFYHYQIADEHLCKSYKKKRRIPRYLHKQIFAYYNELFFLEICPASFWLNILRSFKGGFHLSFMAIQLS